MNFERFLIQRYLPVNNFIDLCTDVGLYGCTDAELEKYEQNRWMYPVARLILPDAYVRQWWKNYDLPPSQQIDLYKLFPLVDLIYHETCFPTDNFLFSEEKEDLRHPIDIYWGAMEELIAPSKQEFIQWNTYRVRLEDGTRQDTVVHYYHAWQIYELYQVRRYRNNFYKDNSPIVPPSTIEFGNIQELYPFLEATSYFRYLFELFRSRMSSEIDRNKDGRKIPDANDTQRLEIQLEHYAKTTVNLYQLTEDSIYEALRGAMNLHDSYLVSERIKLAEALKADIWSMVQLIAFAFNVTTDEVSTKAGKGTIKRSSKNQLEKIFPNRRKEAREKCEKILGSLSEWYNKRVNTGYYVSDHEIAGLLDYLETTDLAFFEYVLVELNDAHFEYHSWKVAASFLLLKSLAAFPESLMKILIAKSPEKDVTELGEAIKKIFKRPQFQAIYDEFSSIKGQRFADTAKDFKLKSKKWMYQAEAERGDRFLGISLSAFVLLRNFTSHHMTEDKEVLEGTYVLSVQVIIACTLLTWKVANILKWV